MNNEEALKHRLTLLEQRMDVQAGEVSQLATEIQKAMEGFAKGTSMALQVIAERLKHLEDKQLPEVLDGDETPKQEE